MKVSSCFRSVRKQGCSVIMLFTVILFCSCASQENRYFPVKNLKARESSLGFSISPPSGARWYEKHNRDSLYYLKITEEKKYSIFAKATEIHLLENKLNKNTFVQFVKEKKKIHPAQGDYRNITFQYMTEAGLSPFCVRYFQKYEDHSKKEILQNDFIVVKNSGLVCMHPETPGNGIDMYYQESYLSSEKEPQKSFEDECEFFLSSLRFF